MPSPSIARSVARTLVGLVLVHGLSVACVRRTADDDGVINLTAPYEETFERPLLGEAWTKTGGSWAIDEGTLHSIGDHNLPVWLNVRLPKNVRVEVTAWSNSPQVDTKLEIFGDGKRHESGYIVIFGGWNNRITTITRRDEHEPSRPEIRHGGEKGRRYRWRVERTDGRTLRWSIDDVEILRYVDEAPLFGPGHDRLGFTSWESDVHYDDLVITPLPD